MRACFFSVFETFCLGKYLCCDRPTMDNSVLFRSIFKEIIQKYILSTSNTAKKILNQKTQRILVFKATRLTALRELVAFRASVPHVFFTGWTEKLPNLVSRLSQNVYDNIKYRITSNFDIAMFNLDAINLIFLQTSSLHSFRYLWHVCLPYELVVFVFDFPSQLSGFTMFTFLIEQISFNWPWNPAL